MNKNFKSIELQKNNVRIVDSFYWKLELIQLPKAESFHIKIANRYDIRLHIKYIEQIGHRKNIQICKKICQCPPIGS